MPRSLSPAELDELCAAFRDLINYRSEDPLEPIDPLTYAAPDGDTCLHIASHRGNLRAVELLLHADLDINRQGDMGNTALHYASTLEIAAFFLAAGASRDVVNEYGKKPVGWHDRS